MGKNRRPTPFFRLLSILIRNRICFRNICGLFRTEEEDMALAGFKRVLLLATFVACVASPLSAQIQDQLSAYTGRNGESYLAPLADAFGADLNAGIFRSASIPKTGFALKLEIQVMSVLFKDEDRTFKAAPERGFTPLPGETTFDAPTVVGSEQAVIVEGASGTSYAFPGGFNLNSFALAVPQLRIGVYGTEAIVRYFAIKAGDTELGDIGLFGIGARHSISQLLPGKIPLDISGGFFWQQFRLGKNKQGGDLIKSNTLSIGVQASKRFLRVFVPYAGLTYDTAHIDVHYQSDVTGEGVNVDIDHGSPSTMHFTIGFLLDLPVLNLYGEYGVANQNTFAFGFGLGFGIGL
jgi:hypothetical protein